MLKTTRIPDSPGRVRRAMGSCSYTVCTKKTIQAGSALLLPLFSFPLYFILFFQRFRVLGAKGPKIKFPKIASAFLFSVCILFLVLTVPISEGKWPYHQNAPCSHCFRSFRPQVGQNLPFGQGLPSDESSAGRNCV